MIRGILSVLDRLNWMGPLVARIIVGYMFFVHGRGKVFPKWGDADWSPDVSGFAKNLDGMGVLWPDVSAWAAGVTELVGGACLVAGFATRFWSVGLCITMGVAAFAAHGGEFMNGSFDHAKFVDVKAVLIFATTFWLVVNGAGPVSVDRAFRNPDED